MSLSLAHQARSLRRLTGLPLARCRAAVESVAPQRRRPAAKQLELEDTPMPEEEVTAAFAECRRQLRMPVGKPSHF